MILKRLTVEGWRCFAERVEVGPFSEGLNVIHGPNGSGKSTLVMALVRCLFDNHDVGGKAVQSLRPWGRQLTPKVTLVFEHDGVTYRLFKQFLDSPQAELSRLEGNGSSPWPKAAERTNRRGRSWPAKLQVVASPSKYTGDWRRFSGPRKNTYPLNTCRPELRRQSERRSVYK